MKFILFSTHNIIKMLSNTLLFMTGLAIIFPRFHIRHLPFVNAPILVTKLEDFEKTRKEIMDDPYLYYTFLLWV
tara:strand:- start:439 stop:660 length:222 start_codon:yes stop_codon:yes gene_type:complete